MGQRLENRVQLNEEQKEAKTKIFNVPISVIVGKAGTGKTLLACHTAVTNLQDKKHGKIIMSRPNVEAGETLGFLKGGVKEKMSPYTYPLEKNFEDIVGVSAYEKLVADKKIEIIPIGHLRGVTFVDSTVIIDESQNVTREQLELIIGRLGKGSQIFFTGDIKQCDLNNNSKNSMTILKELSEYLSNSEMCYIELTTNHRHPIIDKVLTFFEENYDKVLKKVAG